MWVANINHICKHILEYYSSLEQKGNPVIRDNMDEPGKNNAKWNNTGTAKQILNDLLYKSNLNESVSSDRE